jgi:hypothetical protein
MVAISRVATEIDKWQAGVLGNNLHSDFPSTQK